MRVFLVRSGNFGSSDGREEISAAAVFLKTYLEEESGLDPSKVALYSSASNRIAVSVEVLKEKLQIAEVSTLPWLTEPANEQAAVGLEAFIYDGEESVPNAIMVTHLTEICRCVEFFGFLFGQAFPMGLKPGGICLIDSEEETITEIYTAG